MHNVILMLFSIEKMSLITYIKMLISVRHKQHQTIYESPQYFTLLDGEYHYEYVFTYVMFLLESIMFMFGVSTAVAEVILASPSLPESEPSPV